MTTKMDFKEVVKIIGKYGITLKKSVEKNKDFSFISKKK